MKYLRALILFACFASYSSCNTDSDPCAEFTPGLISPADGVILDNGCRDKSNLQTWTFDWEDCAGATNYHLYVKHEGAEYPVIDRFGLTNSEYTHQEYAYVLDLNRWNWNWKVRAYINDEWGPWSEERTFDVEPVDKDCNP